MYQIYFDIRVEELQSYIRDHGCRTSLRLCTKNLNFRIEQSTTWLSVQPFQEFMQKLADIPTNQKPSG